MPIIRSPSDCRCSLWFPYECGGGSVLSRGRPRLRTLPPLHSYGNQRLQRQFDGLLMMGIVMPETCSSVSVRQSNKFYDWLLHLVGCFIWVIILESPEIYFVAGYVIVISKSVALQSTQTQHPNTIRSLLLFLYYMFRPFIQPSSCRKYRNIRENSAVEEVSPSHSI